MATNLTNAADKLAEYADDTLTGYRESGKPAPDYNYWMESWMTVFEDVLLDAISEDKYERGLS